MDVVPASPPRSPSRRARVSGIDALLVLMVLIWSINYSLIKRAFEEIPPQPFNAVRLIVASLVFFLAIRAARRRAERTGDRRSTVFYSPHPLTRADRWQLLGLGLVGQFVYQMCFASGVDQTTVSNAALIIGVTPVAIAVLSAALGRERIGALHWTGAALSAFGIYLVVGHADLGGTHWHGDALILGSVACWTVYSIGSSVVMARHSPLYVTGVTFQIGGVPYVLYALPAILRVHWTAVNPWALVAAVVSSLFALCTAYLIWYSAVRAIGVARTSLYSNLVPIGGTVVAWLWLGEAMTTVKLAGAAAVVSGLFLTRLGRQAPIPAEE